MGELEDRLNSILNDPEALGKITRMAHSMFGGDKPEDGSGVRGKEESVGAGLDPKMLRVMSRLMSGAGTADAPKQRALLEAMKPYLAEKRRRKMEQAMQIAKLARLAEAAFGEMGDGGDGL